MAQRTRAWRYLGYFFSFLNPFRATLLAPPCQAHSLAGLGVSYKRQHYAPRLRKFPGTVQELFEKTIQNASQRWFTGRLSARNETSSFMGGPNEA